MKKKWFTCLNEVLLQWTLEELASLALREVFTLLSIPIKIIICLALSLKNT